MNTKKKTQLINDIQKLLNSYDGLPVTDINPALLEFMDEEMLISIIDSLLRQKEQESESVDLEWLNQFKSEK